MSADTWTHETTGGKGKINRHKSHRTAERWTSKLATGTRAWTLGIWYLGPSRGRRMMLRILAAVGDQVLASDVVFLIRSGPDICNRAVQSAAARPLG